MINEIFIVSTYPDVDGKEELLNDTVTKLKSLGKSVLIASHYPVPSYIVEKADYYIYDAVNIMNVDHTLERDGPDYWMDNNSFRLEAIMTSHPPALSRMFGLSLDFIKCAGYNYFIIIESDSNYDISDLKKFDDLKNKIESGEKKLFFFRPKFTEFSWNGSYTYETYCFGGLLEEFTKILRFPITLEEWRKLYLADTKINCFEYFLYKNFYQNEKDYIINATLKNFLPNSKIDLFSAGDISSVYYNLNNEFEPIIFLSNNTNDKHTCRIFIGPSTLDQTIELSPNCWWMNGIDISKYDTDVCILTEKDGKVIRRYKTKLVKNTIKNLKSYKTIKFK